MTVDELLQAIRLLSLAEFRAKLEKLQKQNPKLYNQFAAFIRK